MVIENGMSDILQLHPSIAIFRIHNKKGGKDKLRKTRRRTQMG